MNRQWLSLGGWCGPSLVLAKMNLNPSYTLPFDMTRCTLDGLIHFVQNGFDKKSFFPPSGAPYGADPVSIWLLFRGVHTCITHFDINRPDVQARYDEAFAKWDSIVASPQQPVTFLRTSIAENPYSEAGLLPLLEETLDTKSQRKLDFKTVLVVHNQGPKTEKVAEPTPRSCVWNLALDSTVPADGSLFDKTEKGYRTIIEGMTPSQAWVGNRPPPKECVNLYRELCTVEGVPAIRGTCKGIGSTATAAVGQCIFCGSQNGHAVENAARFDSNRPWTDAEDDELVIAISTIADVVATCEQIANKQKRSAKECVARLRVLSEQGRIKLK
mmetsp:Transcript_11770/g.13559  ORF Transcript_11770/g.13559 Transcript_11770/m.13559 type:complete len:328 (-) Transcript_11770:23-1006(-)